MKLPVSHQYDVICRGGSLGPLLAALLLARKGKNVLLLPAAEDAGGFSPFLLPVAAGVPLDILTSENLLDGAVTETPGNWFSWTDGTHDFSCPSATDDRRRAFAMLMADDYPARKQHWALFEDIWQVIDRIMGDGLMIPPMTLKDHGKILQQLVKNRVLLDNRSRGIASLLTDSGISPWLHTFVSSFVSLISLYCYQNLPLLSFAYGFATLFQEARYVNIDRLQEAVHHAILDCGGVLSSTDYQVVFDGKWYIGIGNAGKAQIRSRSFIADSDETMLAREIPPVHQRRDFFRQYAHRQPGRVVKHLQCMFPEQSGMVAGRQRRYVFEPGRENELYLLTAGQEAAGKNSMDLYWWESDAKNNDNRWAPALLQRLTGVKPGRMTLCSSTGNPVKRWGYQPRLSPVMGAAFVPINSVYKNFYQVGWETLPGFGLGGVVYGAKMTAEKIATSEYL
ncbi:MAG: hypothetical protein JXO49_02735 [Deltaproteobacteria bacterium]|nr:hypothetical protein [Candidatus Anaeroferrophillus wilburensis]MBN2888245.1 hypothetical protein [Deltaproteobacteria bacterium]